MQGIHCTSDGPWVPARVGAKRAEDEAYVWRELLDSGAIVCNGTDTPVEDVDPIANFHASVTRRLADGSVFYGRQKMTRDGGVALLHVERCLRCIRRRPQGLALGRASSPT